MHVCCLAGCANSCRESMQLPCTSACVFSLHLVSIPPPRIVQRPSSWWLCLMVLDVSTLVLYRMNGVPEHMDSPVDDYAAASSVDEYTAGSATGDKHHQHATAAMQPASLQTYVHLSELPCCRHSCWCTPRTCYSSWQTPAATTWIAMHCQSPQCIAPLCCRAGRGGDDAKAAAVCGGGRGGGLPIPVAAGAHPLDARHLQVPFLYPPHAGYSEGSFVIVTSTS
jgi:hypothetical protein